MHEDDSNSSHCIRGLELFQDESTNEHFMSKKKLYHSTIQMEQMRQAMLGIKDPERFRALATPQSDLALHRARELAAQDEREVYPYRVYAAPLNDLGGKPQQVQDILKKMSTSSFSSNHRLSSLMESIYGSAPPSGTSESGGASVVSDVSSTTSNSSESSSTNGQSLFADESIRKLQERSMRRLMGIYQNNNGEGAEGASETNSLFKFARRDSLLGIRDSTASDTTNASSKNSVWAAPQEDQAPSPQEQLLEILHRRKLLQEQQEQQEQAMASEETTSALEDDIIEMLHQRRLLQEHIHQQQQQMASAADATPSLQEQLVEMIQRRRILEGQQQHQEQDHEQHLPQVSSVLGAIGQSMVGGDSRDDNTTTSSLIENFLIQQQQHQQEHQNKMKLALMAMGASRFPIRRDTLSHVNMEPQSHDDSAAPMNYSALPWNLASMA